MEKIRRGLCDAVNLVSRGATTAADDDVAMMVVGRLRHIGKARRGTEEGSVMRLCLNMAEGSFCIGT